MRSGSNKAFTLIEVLITIGILAVCLVIIFRSFASCLTAVKLSQNMQRAVYLADDVLTEARYRQLHQHQAIAGSQGERIVQGRAFRWECQSQALEDTGLVELQVKVSWQEGLKEAPYDITVNTLLMPALQ